MNRAIDEVESGSVPAVLLVSRNSTDTAYFQRLLPYPRVHLRRCVCVLEYACVHTHVCVCVCVCVREHLCLGGHDACTCMYACIMSICVHGHE